MTGTYRRKPTTIQAVQWTGRNAEEVHDLVGFSVFEPIDEDDRPNADDPNATAALLETDHSAWTTLYDGDYVTKAGDRIAKMTAHQLTEEYEPIA